MGQTYLKLRKSEKTDECLDPVVPEARCIPGLCSYMNSQNSLLYIPFYGQFESHFCHWQSRALTNLAQVLLPFTDEETDSMTCPATPSEQVGKHGLSLQNMSYTYKPLANF